MMGSNRALSNRRKRGLNTHDQAKEPATNNSLFVQESDKDDQDNSNVHNSKRSKVAPIALPISAANQLALLPSQPDMAVEDLKYSTDYYMNAPEDTEHSTDDLDNTADDFDRPKLAIYHPRFKDAERLIRSISDSFLRTVQELASDGYEDHEVQTVCERLIYFRDFAKRYPSIAPVALLGRAGVGKSSTLNCILDSMTLALETDCLERGTYVPHEYHKIRPDQDSVLYAVVPYMRPRQIKLVVSAHFNNIHHWMNLKAAERDEMDDSEEAELKAKCKASILFFCDILREQVPELEEYQEAEDWFRGMKSKTVEAGAEILVEHIMQHMSTLGLEDNANTITASNGQQLKEAVKNLVRPSTNGSASAWALANSVQIHMNCDLLNQGVILTDLPGLDDNNEIVMNKTRKYLGGAGKILVFANIGRVAVDANLDRHIKECIELGKAAKIYLVVTNIDQKTRYRSEEKNDLPEPDRQLLEEAEEVERRWKEKERALLAQKKRNLSDGEYVRVDRELSKTRDEIIAAEARLHQTAVQIRNRQYEQRLKRKLRDLTGSDGAPDLPVYFVSNSEYRKHLSPTEGSPRLDLEATGIPRLRRMLYHIPAEGKFERLEHLCSNRLPGMVNGILGILNFSKLERKQEVFEAVKREMSKLDGIPNEINSILGKCFQSTIEATMIGNDRKWQSVAERQLLAPWQKSYRPTTFGAFCRREGSWRRVGKEPEDFNEQIKEIFARTVSKNFDEIEEKINGQNGMRIEYLGRLSAIFRSLKSALEVHPGFQGVDMKPFFIYILAIEEHASEQLSNAFEATRQLILQIRNKTTVNELNTFVAAAMRETYRKCAGVTSKNHTEFYTGIDLTQMPRKGSGAHWVRVTLLRGKIKGDGAHTASVFNDVLTLIRNEYEAALLMLFQKCDVTIAKAQGYVIQDFDRRYTVEEVTLDEEQQYAVDRLRAAAEDAMRMVEGELSDHIKACKEYEAEGQFVDAT